MTVGQLPKNALDDPTPAGSNMRRRVVETVNQITRAPEWISPTLLNSWADYGTPASAVGFYRDALGIVHLRGNAKDGTAFATIFTLPEGYRPAAAHTFSVYGHNGGATQTAAVNVLNDGSVVAAVGSYGLGAFLALSGISFLAEQ